MSSTHDTHNAHGDDHGHGHGHSGNGGMEWMILNMAGIVYPLGLGFEKLIQFVMPLSNNGFLKRVGIIYIAVFSPVLVILFLVGQILH